MRPEELCISDWVTCKKWRENPFKLTRINDDGKYFYGMTVKGSKVGPFLMEELEPIPLTPEILEKNGFKFDGSGQRSMMLISEPHFSEGIRYNIYVGLKKKTIEVFVAHPVEKSPNWRKSNKAYLEVCGCYVHELQHALHLCGIEKEITI